MKSLKKIVEKPVDEDEMQKLKLLVKGISVLGEQGRKAALEEDLEFMEKKGRYISPEEFHKYIFKVKDIPVRYKTELERYQKMFLDEVSDVLGVPELKNSTIGKNLGVPGAPSNLFEIKQGKKRLGFVLIDNKDSTLDFITESKDLPKKLKTKLVT